MPKVAILGWYGHKNFGDDVLILGGLKNLFTDWKVDVVSNSDTVTYQMINFDAVNNCDLFVLGGGELINEDRLFIPGSWSNNIKVPKIILGCGVNTQKASNIHPRVIKELEQYQFIGVRDTQSFNILNSYPSLKGKVDLFYDCAFALNLVGLSSSIRINKEWGWGPNVKQCSAVVIPTDRQNRKSDKGIREFNLCKKSFNWLIQQLEPYAHTTFIPFGKEDNNDGHTCCELFRCSGVKENSPYIHKSAEIVRDEDVSLSLVVKHISEAELIIPYRLHGLILAYMLNRKYVYYPYHWKLTKADQTLSGHIPEVVKAWQQALFNKVIEGVNIK